MLLNVTNRSVHVVLPLLNKNGVQESVLVVWKMCMSNDISQWSPKLTIQVVEDASVWTALISIEWTYSVNLTVILISCLFWCCILFSAFTNRKEWLLISWCLSVCPSVHMEQLSSHWTDFPEIWYLSIFQNTVEKIQVSLQSARITGTLHEDH